MYNNDSLSAVDWVTQFLATCPTGNQEFHLLNSYLVERNFSAYLKHEVKTTVEDPDFPLVYLASSILKKFQFKLDETPGLDPSLTGWSRFYEAEEQCNQTNVRLRDQRSMKSSDAALLHRMALNIQSVIGDGPDGYQVLKEARFTNGTDSANPYGFTTSYHKYACTPEITRDALPYGVILINSKPRWASQLAGSKQALRSGQTFRDVSILPSTLKTVVGNRVSFVPKNAKTHRAIAVEPHMNVKLQRSVGVIFRNALKRVGIDLQHGQSTNRDLARYGSVRDSVATIDLSMASDTMSHALVESVLPPRWFTFLNAIRSKSGIDARTGGVFQYHKFSSMGNGFTFELESLIFWALIKASIPCNEWTRSVMLTAVYGDDLIVPSQFCEVVIKNLEFIGFKTNAEKTFTDGPFRESCGEDYLNGQNIRPFYLEERFLGHHRRAFYQLANSIRLYANRASTNHAVHRWLRIHWLACIYRFESTHFVDGDYGPDQGIRVTKDEFDQLSPKGRRGGDRIVTFLVPVPDEVKLASLYEKRKREGQHRRTDPHLWMMVSLEGTIHEIDFWRKQKTSSSDSLLNFSKGNPVMYRTKRVCTGVFSDPCAW